MFISLYQVLTKSDIKIYTSTWSKLLNIKICVLLYCRYNFTFIFHLFLFLHFLLLPLRFAFFFLVWGDFTWIVFMCHVLYKSTHPYTHINTGLWIKNMPNGTTECSLTKFSMMLKFLHQLQKSLTRILWNVSLIEPMGKDVYTHPTFFYPKFL